MRLSETGADEQVLNMDENIYVHKKVKSLVFQVLSPKMVKDMASAKIVTPELYDKEGYPVDGGLMDIRLGVIDPGLKCKTCGSKLKECVGHFGYIELARPIIHLNFVGVIQLLLNSTCRECSRILIPQEKLDEHKQDVERVEKQSSGGSFRRKAVKDLLTDLKSVSKCPHCKAKQGKITLEKPTTFLESEKRISPVEIRTRMEKIPDDDVQLFGISPKAFRPEWAVLTILPIPPVTMRPSITLESGERSEDDLTHKMGDIVRINQRLFENINAGAPEIIIEDLWDLLQYHITTFFDNDVAQLPPARHRSGQPLKTISERIKSKEGRIRHNLAGKRTNFSARTVISPDPNILISEVGVPLIMAMKLTVPEKVTEWNAAYLKKFIETGPDKYPGANYIVRPDGKKKKITDETKEASLEELQPGYAVERHLMNGDIAIFNRQPSLHRMSMMCHRVRVLPGRTFRLNPAVCHPYNADFDGDEMNLHIPQTEEARVEAETLMEVQSQLISPRYGLSVIGCTQDALAGNYSLTKDFRMGREEAVQLLSSVGVTHMHALGSKETVDGLQIFSAMLPPDFNFTGKSRNGDPFVVKNGKVMEGKIDKGIIGEESGVMLREYHRQYGAKAAIDLIDRLFHLGINVLDRIGFSVSLYDIDLPPEARSRIQQVLDKAYVQVDQMIVSFRDGSLEVFPGRTMAETLELRILEILNKARNETGKVVNEFGIKNTDILNMVNSGARGNLLNLAQMAACVGQQAMRGKRIEKGYRGRTLPHFRMHDLRPAARGFIRDGFKGGLLPHEFFFIAITGRDSLMDTALRTPKSGYLYRRLANAMQDLKVEYDMTVRDASKKIVQFQYGEDGIDVAKSEYGKLNVARMVEK